MLSEMYSLEGNSGLGCGAPGPTEGEECYGGARAGLRDSQVPFLSPWAGGQAMLWEPLTGTSAAHLALSPSPAHHLGLFEHSFALMKF